MFCVVAGIFCAPRGVCVANDLARPRPDGLARSRAQRIGGRQEVWQVCATFLDATSSNKMQQAIL